jgi:hypothetical protein
MAGARADALASSMAGRMVPAARAWHFGGWSMPSSGDDPRPAGNGGEAREPLPPTLFRFTSMTRVLLILALLAFAGVSGWAAANGQPTVALAALTPIFLAGVGLLVARALRDGAFNRAEDDDNPLIPPRPDPPAH